MPKYKVSASTVPGHTALRVCLLSVPEHQCLVTGTKWCCVHTLEYPISNCVPYLPPFALSYSILKLELNMEYKAVDCPSNVRTVIRCPLSCPSARSPNLNISARMNRFLYPLDSAIGVPNIYMLDSDFFFSINSAIQRLNTF